MQRNYSENLSDYMERQYRKRGASSNGAQLILREDHLIKMVNRYGEDKVRDMLENDFDRYHNEK